MKNASQWSTYFKRLGKLIPGFSAGWSHQAVGYDARNPDGS